MKALPIALAALVVAACAIGACGHSSENGFSPPPGSDDGGTTTTGDGSVSPTYDGSLVLPVGEGGTPPQGSLAISPLAPVVNVVTGQPLPTVQFSATVGGQPASNVKWLLDRGELGRIDTTGLFTPAGNIAGTGNVTGSYGGAIGTTTVTVNIQTTQQGDPGWTATPADAGAGGYGGVGGDGPGAPPTPGQIGALNGTPTGDPAVSILYPYDGTVWPQGLLAPLLQWSPASHSFDSVYVHIQEKNFEYKGYFAANKAPFVNVPIPEDAWTAMGYSNGGEPVTVSLVFGEGSKAVGPYTETWKVAQGALQGTIYYNSYGTSLVLNSGSDHLDAYNKQFGAGTLAIAPGSAAPRLVAGIPSINPAGDGTGCRVCHTASADGTTLVTQGSTANASSYADSKFVNLISDPTGGAGTNLAATNLAFPALYRDGSLLFSNAAVMESTLIPGDGTSKLYSLPAGTLVPGVLGLPAGFAAGLPSFSPDGKHVSFNFWAGTLPTGATGDQVSLGVIDFDGTKTFSNLRVVYTPPGVSGGEPAVTYSSFLPGSSSLVFEQELSNGGDTADWAYTWAYPPTAPLGHTGELWWLDLGTGTPHPLDQLNGRGAAGVYLPSSATHTSAQDATLNYEPTVTPIASGGYAWVVFTSRRLYGNVATLPPWTSDVTNYKWHDPGNVTTKKLWVAAVDLNAPANTDPSHPAFYLPGQELYAGNSRGYWTVPPCRPDGTSCQVGDQCCGGFCETAADGGLVCTAQKPTCAATFDKCATTSDCCGATSGIQCINDICTVSGPPK